MPIIIAIVIALAIGFSGGLKWQDGKVARVEAKLEKAEALAKTNYDRALAWKAQKETCETNRKTEAQKADDALASLKQTCQAEIGKFTKSRSTLERIYTKLPKAPRPEERITCPELGDLMGGRC